MTFYTSTTFSSLEQLSSELEKTHDALKCCPFYSPRWKYGYKYEVPSFDTQLPPKRSPRSIKLLPKPSSPPPPVRKTPKKTVKYPSLLIPKESELVPLFLNSPNSTIHCNTCVNSTASLSFNSPGFIPDPVFISPRTVPPKSSDLSLQLSPGKNEAIRTAKLKFIRNEREKRILEAKEFAKENDFNAKSALEEAAVMTCQKGQNFREKLKFTRSQALNNMAHSNYTREESIPKAASIIFNGIPREEIKKKSFFPLRS
ncbi:hypothetical protein RCL1_007085 [Eukaryota sp. TZLM3-RCL]